MIIRQSTTYKPGVDHFSTQLKHGLAVPNRSLSVKQILTMHHSALPPIQMMPLYPPDVIPNLNAMDYQEVIDYRKSIAGHVVDLRNMILKRRADFASATKSNSRAKRKAALDAASEALTFKAAAEAGINVSDLK